MKVSYKWLKDYVDIEVAPEKYASAMTMTGSKVEGIEILGEEIVNVVVAKILSIKEHPDADNLVVCSVDSGDGNVQVVTGAKNVREGDYIPLAKIGAKLPGGIKLKKTKLRGVLSEGMMCSIQELGLTKNDIPDADEDGILILDEEYPIGTDIKEVLGLDDIIFEFEITSNRPDCLSIIGIARETAVTFDKELKISSKDYKSISDNINDYISIEVEDSDLCPRYSAKLVKDINIKKSPKWMRERLRAAGVRPINNIVDITNFVMLEYGQPMHAFDMDYIEGNKIVIRRAKKDEVISTLDEQERKLDNNMLVISDDKKAVAVAGVMGGENSEVIDSTKTILFESANFLPGSVRSTSKKLGLRTESSIRFEKGIDIENTIKALDRACQLIEELEAGKVVGGLIDIKGKRNSNPSIVFNPSKLNKFLGTDIDEKFMTATLQKLGFDVDTEKMIIKVPSFRLDVENEADIAEEVLRIYGYEKIPSTRLIGETTIGVKNNEQIIEDKIKDNLVAGGLNEIITYSFMGTKVFDMLKVPMGNDLRNAVKIKNPLGEENSLMRTTTMHGMLETISRNINHGIKKGEFFELGKIFIPSVDLEKELHHEKKIVSIGMYGSADFYDIKGVVEELLKSLGINDCDFTPETQEMSFHPGRTSRIFLGKTALGIIGEVHPDVLEKYDISSRTYIGMLDFNCILSNAKPVREFKPLPKYPAISRDIALIVDKNIMVKQIEAIIKDSSGKLLESIELFDVYTGEQIPEDKKSVAYSITYRDNEKTLRDDEINSIFNKIIDKLKNNIGAELR